MARLFRIITVQENKTISDNSGFPVYDVKHIWWDYLIVNSWDLQMNNRWCLLRRVPLCLPSLLKEFQIVSGQHVSFGVLYRKVFFKTGCSSIMLPWCCTYHTSSQNRFCLVFCLCSNVNAVTCCPEFWFLNLSWICLYNQRTCLLCSRLLL